MRNLTQCLLDVELNAVLLIYGDIGNMKMTALRVCKWFVFNLQVSSASSVFLIRLCRSMPMLFLFGMSRIGMATTDSWLERFDTLKWEISAW